MDAASYQKSASSRRHLRDGQEYTGSVEPTHLLKRVAGFFIRHYTDNPPPRVVFGWSTKRAKVASHGVLAVEVLFHESLIHDGYGLCLQLIVRIEGSSRQQGDSESGEILR